MRIYKKQQLGHAVSASIISHLTLTIHDDIDLWLRKNVMIVLLSIALSCIIRRQFVVAPQTRGNRGAHSRIRRQSEVGGCRV